MQRRTFFKWIGSSVLPFIVPRWVSAQAGAITTEGAVTLRALSSVVLPASLGRAGLDTATAQFTTWIRNYKAGAEMSTGYGFPRVQVVGPDLCPLRRAVARDRGGSGGEGRVVRKARRRRAAGRRGSGARRGGHRPDPAKARRQARGLRPPELFLLRKRRAGLSLWRRDSARPLPRSRQVRRAPGTVAVKRRHGCC